MKTKLEPFSVDTVREYVPVIQAILASYEVSLADPTIDERATLRVSYLEKEFGASKLIHTMRLLDQWLQDTPFKAETFFFEKKKSAKWKDMLGIISKKLMQYIHAAPALSFALSRDGDVSIIGTDKRGKFKHGTQLLDLLLLIATHKGYTKTSKLAEMLETNTSTVQNTKKKINAALRRMFSTHEFIQGEPGPGYRVNPKYEILVID